MKNAFYFTLKALFVLNIFKFLSSLFSLVKNSLIRKIRLISKSVASQPAQQTISIHIIPNISRSKCNQTMKFGQLVEYNMGNIFVEKSYTKCGGETLPNRFSKKSKLSLSLDQQFTVLYSLLLLYANLRVLRAIEIQ